MLYTTIIVILAVINIIGFIIVAIDKYKARKGLWRIPEKTLFLMAVLGGCIGVFVSMLLFRHKTKHLRFMVGIPAIFIIQILIAYYFI